jgi:hypothetical protein
VPRSIEPRFATRHAAADAARFEILFPSRFVDLLESNMRSRSFLPWFAGRRWPWAIASIACLVLGHAMWVAAKPPEEKTPPQVTRGKEVFRYDTFGDEAFWTDTLRMHEVIQESLDPLTALSLGLKVDVDALPPEVLEAIAAGQVDLTDPATTLVLLEHDAVVGVMGSVETIDGQRQLTKVGITCALCHSTVDDASLPGVGHRLDGWANIDLNPGAIIAASPAVPDNLKAVYNSWGPGKYDPRFSIDGLNTPLVIPPAYGLAAVAKETYTGDGDVSYWNNYVAVTQMGGQGVFVDPRLDLKVRRTPDRVHGQLPALLDYQLSLPAPAAPPESYDAELAAKGKRLFESAGCADCHIAPLYTDVNLDILHDPAEVGQDGAYAQRTVTGKYRTTPLRGLLQHPPYFHDGSAATLLDVVEHYDGHFQLDLDEGEKDAIVEFLKTL